MCWKEKIQWQSVTNELRKEHVLRSPFFVFGQGLPQCIMGDDLHINKQTNILIANHRRLLRQNN
jgi:hypothetical protein